MHPRVAAAQMEAAVAAAAACAGAAAKTSAPGWRPGCTRAGAAAAEGAGSSPS